MEEQRIGEVELAKQRCRCVIDTVHRLPDTTNITDSCRRTLLKLALSELSFLSRPSSSFASSTSMPLRYTHCVSLFSKLPIIKVYFPPFQPCPVLLKEKWSMMWDKSIKFKYFKFFQMNKFVALHLFFFFCSFSTCCFIELQQSIGYEETTMAKLSCSCCYYFLLIFVDRSDSWGMFGQFILYSNWVVVVVNVSGSSFRCSVVTSNPRKL